MFKTKIKAKRGYLTKWFKEKTKGDLAPNNRRIHQIFAVASNKGLLYNSGGWDLSDRAFHLSYLVVFNTFLSVFRDLENASGGSDPHKVDSSLGIQR